MLGGAMVGLPALASGGRSEASPNPPELTGLRGSHPGSSTYAHALAWSPDTKTRAFERATEPFRVFMLSQVRDKDLQLFEDIGQVSTVEVGANAPLKVLVPAFMISELRRAFEIGFLIYLPFVIIDMVVASILMSMGMMMVPPVIVSLPFKLIFFVLVDGWYLIVGSLVRSFGAS